MEAAQSYSTSAVYIAPLEKAMQSPRSVGHQTLNHMGDTAPVEEPYDHRDRGEWPQHIHWHDDTREHQSNLHGTQDQRKLSDFRYGEDARQSQQGGPPRYRDDRRRDPRDDTRHDQRPSQSYQEAYGRNRQQKSDADQRQRQQPFQTARDSGTPSNRQKELPCDNEIIRGVCKKGACPYSHDKKLIADTRRKHITDWNNNSSTAFHSLVGPGYSHAMQEYLYDSLCNLTYGTRGDDGAEERGYLEDLGDEA